MRPIEVECTEIRRTTIVVKQTLNNMGFHPIIKKGTVFLPNVKGLNYNAYKNGPIVPKNSIIFMFGLFDELGIAQLYKNVKIFL